MEKIRIENLKGLYKAAGEFLEMTGDSKVVAFYGSMGAGKTTFIKALCSVLGVEDDVNSPTFNIVNEYHSDSGDVIYHFDFYRIESVPEALDIGFEEYVYSGNLCLMEWPEKIEQILPDDVLKVQISVQDDDSRIISRIE
jgi:tRNA threonylcarbamoyladenosine biosynthesis protein TsaE